MGGDPPVQGLALDPVHDQVQVSPGRALLPGPMGLGAQETLPDGHEPGDLQRAQELDLVAPAGRPLVDLVGERGLERLDGDGEGEPGGRRSHVPPVEDPLGTGLDRRPDLVAVRVVERTDPEPGRWVGPRYPLEGHHHPRQSADALTLPEEPTSCRRRTRRLSSCGVRGSSPTPRTRCASVGSAKTRARSVSTRTTWGSRLGPAASASTAAGG